VIELIVSIPSPTVIDEPVEVPDPPSDYSSMTVEERIETINSITASLFKEKWSSDLIVC